MKDFHDVLDFLDSLENDKESKRPEPLSAPEIKRLRETYVEIPEDFIEYLTQVGAGQVNNCRYMVYGELLKPSDIFDFEDVQEIEHLILLFGDDFAGNPAGFLVTDKWKIAEISHTSLHLFNVEPTFSEFIRQAIGMND